MHPLFSRQLARLGIAEDSPPSPDAWAKLLERISLAYTEADQARYVLERSLEMSSREMQELYERHRASSEYLIALERDKLAAVLRSVAAGVLTLDYAERVASVNPEVERLLGFAEAEMRGRNACELLGVPHLDGSEASSQYDAAFSCKDGSRLPVSYALTPIRQGHAEVGGVLVFFDLTERQKVERLKSDFVSTVSHELRTPLTAIRGALGLLSGGVLGELTPDAMNVVQIAHQNAERLVRLVNDILDMQKIEAGKMDFDLTVCDLAELVERSISDNRAYVDQFSVRMALAARPDRALVRVDRHRILQVLANLISNAAKFSPPGGEVMLRCVEQGGAFCVEVSDQGRGIPEEFRDQIFGKFAQADASASRPRGGTGLGLSISKSIIECHEGAIDFHAREGGGTTFYFTIPTLDAVQERRAHP
jgi:PAS domain S-box-containing protein